MKILESLIKWMKAGNFVLVLVVLIVGTIMALSIELGKVLAQEHGATDTQAQEVATGGEKTSQSSMTWGFIAAALSTGLSCIAAGIAVAIVGSAAMGAMAERPEVMGRSIIFVGLAEGIAIYGLIISIMILGKL